MYKDPDKQKEANRQAKMRQREREGMTTTLANVIPDVIPKERTAQGNMSIETLAEMDAGCGDKLSHGLKRGKDIKVFADLPIDVRASIDRLSVVDGKIDQTTKANRTAIAVNYQHQFPNRFHSTGVN